VVRAVGPAAFGERMSGERKYSYVVPRTGDSMLGYCDATVVLRWYGYGGHIYRVSCTDDESIVCRFRSDGCVVYCASVRAGRTGRMLCSAVRPLEARAS
jgi:hypothetical protein